MTRAPFRVLRGVGYRPITSSVDIVPPRKRVGHVRRARPSPQAGRPSNTPSRSNGHRPPFLVPAALPPDRTRPDAFDPRPGRRRTAAAGRAGFHSAQLPKPQHGDPAVCLTLANAAFVLDHVNSVSDRPAASPVACGTTTSSDDMDHRRVVGGISGSSGLSSIRTTVDGGALPSLRLRRTVPPALSTTTPG